MTRVWPQRLRLRLSRGQAVWPVPGLLLLAFALRLLRLGEQNIWWDEGLAIWAARKSLIETTLWTAADVHPPLFFWTLWGWIRLAGQSPFAARYLMVAWSLLLAALAYALGRRLGGPRAGLLSLALVALSRYMVWWSMELRMYMLAALAVALAVYASLRWLDAVTKGAGNAAQAEEGRKGLSRPAILALVAYIAAATAALYTVYLTAAALLAINAVVLGTWLAGAYRQRRGEAEAAGEGASDGSPDAGGSRSLAPAALAAWLAAQALVVLLFLPWLALALPRMQSWSVVAEPAAPGFVVQLWATLLATGLSLGLDSVRLVTRAWWLAAFLLPLALLAARGRRPRRKGRRPWPAWSLLALFALFPPLIVWAASQPRALFYSPNVEARYFLPFAAPVYVLAGLLLAAVWRRRPLAGGALSALALGLMLMVLPAHYRERRLQDAYASMALAIWSQAEAGDAVLLVSGNRYPLFLYDYDQPWDRDNGLDFRYLAADLAVPPGRPPVIPFPDRGSAALGAEPWQDRLVEIVAAHPRVWLAEVDRHLQDPDGEVEAWLNEQRTRVLSEAYGPNALHLYAQDGQAPRLTQLDSRWPGLRLWSGRPEPGFQPLFGRPAAVAMPGDAVSVTLFRDPVAGSPPRKPTKLYWLAWPPGWAPTASAPLAGAGGAAAERLRAVLAVSERTPAGRGPLGLFVDEAALGELRVRGTAPGEGRLDPIEAEVGPLRLTAARIAPRRLQPGETVVVDLIWEGRRSAGPGPVAEPWAALPDPPPVVFAHLVGPPRPEGGSVWAGQDGPPSSGAWADQVGGRVLDRHVLTLDPAAPPGSYALEVGLYDPQTGERYPVAGQGADPARGSLRLGTVEVRP